MTEILVPVSVGEMLDKIAAGNEVVLEKQNDDSTIKTLVDLR